MKTTRYIARYIIPALLLCILIHACVPNPSVFEQNANLNQQGQDFDVTYPNIETRSDATLAPDLALIQDMNRIDMMPREDMFIADPQLSTHSIQWTGSPTVRTNSQTPYIFGTFEWSHSTQR